MTQNDDITRLRGLLACHGSDVSQWPGEAKTLWFAAQRRPELAALIEEERRFERLLKKHAVPHPSRDLAGRIMATAFTRTQAGEASGWLSDLLAEIRPSALAAMLVLGFAIGFGMLAHAPSSSGDAALAKAYSDDDGTLL